MDPLGPVFVVGCPRSGTSALSWASAAHACHWTSVASHFFYHLSRDSWFNSAWSDSRGPNAWIDRYAVDEDAFLACAGIGFDQMTRARTNGRQWIDGLPENLMAAGVIPRMFGQAPIASFPRGNTVNSSANKQSYVEESPFQGNFLVNLDPAMFQDLYGARIQEETAVLAAKCGYGRE